MNFSINKCDHLKQMLHIRTPSGVRILGHSDIGGGNLSELVNTSSSALEGSPDLETAKWYLLVIVQPILCCFGIIGNSLNIIVLSRKKFKCSLDCGMEVAAVCGLIALAVSDTLYCISTLPEAFPGKSITVFNRLNFLMMCHMYGAGIQNIFSHTSTWFTVMLATARYIAICRPIHARYLLETRATIIAVVSITVFWILISLPVFWTYTYLEINCDEDEFTILILDQGYFVKHKTFKMVFTYIWSILGFFLPVCVLSFCNIHLIKALKESLRMRKLYRVNTRNQNSGSHITPTLVAVICQFIILMTPSEILQFYYYTSGKSKAEYLTFAIVVTNLLQTLNFSMNFILYCIVNTRFRGTVWQIVECRRLGLNRRNSRSLSSRRSSYGVSQTRMTLMANNKQ